MVLSNSQWLASSSTGTDLVSVGNSTLFTAINQSLSRTQVAGSNTVGSQ